MNKLISKAIQMMKNGLDYFKDGTNYVDLSWIGLNVANFLLNMWGFS